MSAPTSTSRDGRTVSWVASTWVVPVVVTVWLLAFLLIEGSSDITDSETGGFAVGLGLGLVIALIGGVMTRANRGGVRGLGFGLLAGGLSCAIPSLWVLLT